MAKSIKLKNENYIDSSSICYRKVRLDDIFNFVGTKSSINTAATNQYCKLFEITLTQSYETAYIDFSIIETENVGMIFDGKIFLHADYSGKIVSYQLMGEYSNNAIEAKLILYVEKNNAHDIKISFYIKNTYNWRTFNFKINSIFNSKRNDFTNINILKNSSWIENEPQYVAKREL